MWTRRAKGSLIIIFFTEMAKTKKDADRAILLQAAVLVNAVAVLLDTVRLRDRGITDAIRRTAGSLRSDRKWLLDRAKEL